MVFLNLCLGLKYKLRKGDTYMKIVRRGYLPEYDKYFKSDLDILIKASEDARYLLNRGYKVKGATVFVQQHYQLSEPQRLAIARSIATDSNIVLRRSKELSKDDCKGKEVYIDGFNAIIPMESLLSNSPILDCMDGSIRDMANLKGSYHIIDKTSGAIQLVLEQLQKLGVLKAHFYFDRPVSNSGRLKCLLLELSKQYNVDVDVELLNAVDKELYDKSNVITGDCVILDKCISFIPLYRWIIEDYSKSHDVWKVKLL